ncbi:2-dehydropantoate 2-reductase [Porphyromonas macacae]|uniref:2-dehydropantoate 2-reductase n=1 Tax=Porphyromonas macacae TaxID=28115 RepID=A0A379EAK5_9PORP|nr:2-dehydropantoate 2-reductase [Porphyromonas macacae]SUB89402.1 2-dehydropantoate 2-reductase [Porphyromonas macacae]
MIDKTFNIVVSGIGGVGGYYGALLAKYSQEINPNIRVWFVARGEHLKVISDSGLQVTTPSRNFIVHPAGADDNMHNLPKADLLIVATKSYDLKVNIDQLKPIIGHRTVILPLLNGANITEQIKDMLPETEVWYGCVYISARKGNPGSVYLESDSESFYFGSGKKIKTELECKLLDLFLESGINARNPENIRYVVREKFMMISATATATSYFNCPVGEVMEKHPDEMKHLREELIELSILQGYPMTAEEVEAGLLKKQYRMPADSTSSMHVDFLKGSKTELENLTGYVVHSANTLGLQVPTYEKMYEGLKADCYPLKVKE